MNKLPVILFTSAFPFGNGEQFIETELGFLSEAFDPIYIFPYYYAGNRESRGQLPDNVTVLQPFRNESLTPITLVIRGIFNCRTLFPYLGELIRKPGILLSRKRFSNWFRSLLHCRMILNDERLKKVLSGSSPKGILYFYWGHRPAGISAGLKASGWHSVVRFHGTDLYEEMPLNDGYIPFQQLVAESIQHIVCVSAFGLKYLSEKYVNISGKIVLQRLGTADYGTSPLEGPSFLRIVSCSTVDENKQVLELAGVIGRLELPVEWTHIGDGPLMATLRNIADGIQNENRRITLTGRLSNRQVHELYQSDRFDLFVNISKSEGVPFSIMEALSHAIPVMATAVGGTPEIVDASCGMLLPATVEDNEIIRRLKYLASLPVPQMQLLREGARRRWEETCNATVNYGNFVRFLTDEVLPK